VPESAELLRRLEANGQIALRYLPDDSPNGSVGNVAGICDASGLVFGLMPHPERYTSWLHHPLWTRLGAQEMAGEPLGLRMFRNAVAYAGTSRPRGGESSKRRHPASPPVRA
jgi:phosphoribosylformylglycinamidine synthase